MPDEGQSARFHPATLLPLATASDVRAAQLLRRAVVEIAAHAPTASASLEGAASSGVAGVLEHRAVAVVRHAQGRLADALAHAREAVEIAGRLADPVALSESKRTLAMVLADAGEGQAAQAAADDAVALVSAHEHAHARALAHRGMIRQLLGHAGWEGDFAAALPKLLEAQDGYWVATLKLNRGYARAYVGQLTAARRDLADAVAAHERDGRSTEAAFARHNLGFVECRAGNLAAALAAYEDAEAVLTTQGVDMSPAVPDMAEALLSAGLTDEAITLLRDRLDTIVQRQPALAPEAMLMLARALLTTGALEEAAHHAVAAVDLFEDQERPGWARLARGVHVLTVLPLDDVAPAEVVRTADRTAAAGWTDVAAEIRAAAARQAAETGDPAIAGRLLAPIGELDDLPLAPQLAVARARMAISRSRGDPAAALGHAADALERLEERRVLLGASELRASVTGLAEDVLARASLAALELGDLDRALEWVDRARSQALDQPPVVPPGDGPLADDLGRLRVLSDQLARRRAEGEAVTDLLVDIHELERRVRDRARTASGARTDATQASVRRPGTTEIAYLDLGEHLAALVTSDAGTRRVDLELGRDEVVHELDALGFAMQRVGSARSPGRRRELAARSLDHSLATLDAALVTPLGLGDDDRVVVSPTDVLFDVPWSGLPGLADRALAVAPALRLSRRPPRDDATTGTLLLEGPRLSHARAELDALAEVVADVQTILGDEATVAAARAALPEVAVAHLACHGVFRADNPQFSSLELADGPMFVYDLESLPRVPELIVLSACQTGRSAVHVGDELLGVTASLLALGARTVVAALADVPDDLSALLMVAFHQHVRAGAHPAEALAHARRTLLASRDEPAARLTAAAFVCLGAP